MLSTTEPLYRILLSSETTSCNWYFHSNRIFSPLLKAVLLTWRIMVLAQPHNTYKSFLPSSIMASHRDNDSDDTDEKMMMFVQNEVQQHPPQEEETHDLMDTGDSTSLDIEHNNHEKAFLHQQQRPRGGSMSVLMEQEQRLRLQEQHQQQQYRNHPSVASYSNKQGQLQYQQPLNDRGSKNNESNIDDSMQNISVVELAASALTSLRGVRNHFESIPQHQNLIRDNNEINFGNVRTQQRRRSMSVNDASASSSSLSSSGVGMVMRQAKKAASSLCILLHAQNCETGSNLSCPVAGCREAKVLHAHLKSCTVRNDVTQCCPDRYHGCDQARKLLSHYRQCKSARVGRRALAATSTSSSTISIGVTMVPPSGATPGPSMSLPPTSPQCLVCSLVGRLAKSMLAENLPSSSQNTSTSSTTFAASSLATSLNNGKKISPKSAPNAGRITSTKFTLCGNSSGNGSSSSSSGIVTLHIPNVSTTTGSTLNPDTFDRMDVNIGTSIAAGCPSTSNSMPPPPPRLPKSGLNGGITATCGAILSSPVSMLATPSSLSSHLNVLSYTAAQRDPIIVFPTAEDQFDTISNSSVDVNNSVVSMILDNEVDEPKISSPRRSRPRSFSHGSFLSPSTKTKNNSFDNDSGCHDFDGNYETRSRDTSNFVEEVQQHQPTQHDEQCSNDVDAIFYDGSSSECEQYQQHLLRRQRSSSIGSCEGYSSNVAIESKQSPSWDQQMKKSTSFTSPVRWVTSVSSCETIPEHHQEDEQQHPSSQTK